MLSSVKERILIIMTTTNVKLWELCILHTNDRHGYVENLGKCGGIINDIREENNKKNIDTLLFDCGDAFSGSIYFNLYHGTKDAELMNLLKYDAMTFGNHEFDGGSSILSGFIGEIKFPIVTSNVDVSKDNLLNKFLPKKNNHDTLNMSKIVPYLIKESAQGIKFGVIGLTTVSTADESNPDTQITFNDPISSAEKIVKQLNKKGVQIIIVLSHLGLATDIELAEKVFGIGVIIGGHSHELIEEPLQVSHGVHKSDNTIIVQAGQYGEYLGELRLWCDWQSAKITKVKGHVHKISASVKNDKKVGGEVNKMIHEIKHLSEGIVGVSGSVLSGEVELLKIGQGDLGEIIADAFYTGAIKEKQIPDIAIMSGDGIRSSLEKGTIHYKDILNVLPFSNEMMLIKVTGQDILTSLERGLLPQVAQMKVTFDTSAQQGRKIIQCLVKENGKYQKINIYKTYKIVTNALVANGKDGFVGFDQTKIIFKFDKLDVDFLSEYLQGLHNPIVYRLEGRVTYLK